MRLLSFLIGLVFIAVCVIFAVSNLQNADVSLWPFDAQISTPLFILVLGSLALGLAGGGGLVWLQHWPHRLKARRLGKSVAELSDRLIEAERELEHYRAERTAREDMRKPPLLPGPKWRFWKRF